MAKQTLTPNLKREVKSSITNMKNKLINLNNSISNNVNINPNITNSSNNQKSAFSSSMKEQNKKLKTLEDENYSINNENKRNKKSVSALKSRILSKNIKKIYKNFEIFLI
jgi:hypothetical protein